MQTFILINVRLHSKNLVDQENHSYFKVTTKLINSSDLTYMCEEK